MFPVAFFFLFFLVVPSVCTSSSPYLSSLCPGLSCNGRYFPASIPLVLSFILPPFFQCSTFVFSLIPIFLSFPSCAVDWEGHFLLLFLLYFLLARLPSFHCPYPFFSLLFPSLSSLPFLFLCVPLSPSFLPCVPFPVHLSLSLS